MKKLFLLFVVLFTGCSLFVPGEKFATEEKVEQDIRVLLLYGGHKFQQEPFFKMFDNLPRIKYKAVDMMKLPDILKPGLEKEYDVIVRYDMFKKPYSKKQRQGFIDLLTKGIGLVCLHHSIGAHEAWPEYVNIIGAKYFRKPNEMFRGKEYKRSVYAHDQNIDVKVVNKKHPITKELKDFTIHDETYKGYVVLPKARVLLKTDHPKNNSEIGWVTQYGKSPVFYLQLGHDSKAWSNPNYIKLLANAIKWASQ